MAKEPLKRGLKSFPGVSEIINYGYAIHAADDESLTGTEAKALAVAIVNELKQLNGKVGTLEEAYMREMRHIAFSYGRALARRKREWRIELENAATELKRREESLAGARKRSIWMATLWRALGPAVLALAGYLVAQVVGVLVPEAISVQTGDKVPSLFGGLAFLFIGRQLGEWWKQRERELIVLAHEHRRHLADHTYNHGKVMEYQVFYAQACEVWKRYTGRPHKNNASYELVLRGDIATIEAIERLRVSSNQHMIVHICKWVWERFPKRRPVVAAVVS